MAGYFWLHSEVISYTLTVHSPKHQALRYEDSHLLELHIV